MPECGWLVIEKLGSTATGCSTIGEKRTRLEMGNGRKIIVGLAGAWLMKNLAVDEKIARRETAKENYVLDDQHLPADTFSIRTIPIFHIGEGAAGSRSDNDHHGADTAPEEESLKLIEHRDDLGVPQMSIMQNGDSNNRRQPDPGGEVMNKSIKNYCALLDIHRFISHGQAA